MRVTSPYLMMSKRGRVIYERDLYFVYLHFVLFLLDIFSLCGHVFVYVVYALWTCVFTFMSCMNMCFTSIYDMSNF